MRLRSPQTLHYQKRTLLRASIELYKCLRLFFVSDPTQQVTSLPEPQWEYSHQRQVRFPLARVEGLALLIQSMQRLPGKGVSYSLRLSQFGSKRWSSPRLTLDIPQNF